MGLKGAKRHTKENVEETVVIVAFPSHLSFMGGDLNLNGVNILCYKFTLLFCGTLFVLFTSTLLGHLLQIHSAGTEPLWDDG
jgi:hypothetical protein